MMTTDPPQPRQRELLNEGQRDALAGLIRSYRRDSTHGPVWDMAGIHAGIRRAEQVADSGIQLCAAALAAAANPEVKTPGFIAQPGRHWPDLGNGDRQQPTRLTTNVPCPEHEQHTIPCRACRAETRPAQPGELTAAARAAARTGSEKRDEQERGVERRRAAARRGEAGEPAGGPGSGGAAAGGGAGSAPGGADDAVGPVAVAHG